MLDNIVVYRLGERYESVDYIDEDNNSVQVKTATGALVFPLDECVIVEVD